MKISLGGIVITNLKKVLSLSSGILIATGMNSACFATETNTASSVLSNLLTTTADAIAPNQTQAKPATPQPAEGATSSDATALPTFDEPATGAPATATAPAVSANAEAVPATTPQPSAVPQPATPSATTPAVTQPTTTAVTTVVATPSEVPAVVATGQTAPVQASAEPATQVQPTQVVAEPKKKVGFLSQNGMVLIAPEDMVFPSEMQDGGMYFFSRDIDTLKKKITAGEMALPVQQVLTTPAQATPQPSTVVAAPATQIPPTPSSSVTVMSPVAPSTQAEAQPQSPAPQNDCPGCHVWLKTTI